MGERGLTCPACGKRHARKFLKQGQSKIHRRFLRVYARNVRKMYRAVKGWLKAVDDAVSYGIETQLILGYSPDISHLDYYVPPDPADLEDALEKAIVVARSKLLADSLGKAFFISDVTASLADWHCLRMKGDKTLGRQSLDIYAQSADTAFKVAKQKTVWDIVNRHAVDWAAENSAKKVTLITEETRSALRQVFRNGIEQGKSVPTIARQIRALQTADGSSMVGLNTGQMNAMQKLTDKLYSQAAKSPGGLTPTREARIKRKLERELRKKRAYRAEMIARTETADAVSAGSLTGYREAGAGSIQFESSADACEVCLGYDGHIYDTAVGEGIIPVHPNCRCSWRPHIPEAAGFTDTVQPTADLPPAVTPGPKLPSTTFQTGAAEQTVPETYAFQAYGTAEKRINAKVAEGYRASVGPGFGQCTQNALKQYRESGMDVYVGTAVETEKLERAKEWFEQSGGFYPTESFPHAWNMKDGKIVDSTLGSKEARDHAYFGFRVPKKVLDGIKDGDELANWHIGHKDIGGNV